MTGEELFLDYYQKLNKAQKEAVDTIDGPVMVMAGPGTGKTQILTLRIANILRQTDTAPEQILALTFTKSGVYSMKKRLAEIVGSRGYKVNIYTFHGFCNEVIQQYPEEFPTIIGRKPATDVDRINLFKEAIVEASSDVLRSFGDQFFYLFSIMSEVDKLKRENILPADLKKLVVKQKQDFDSIPDLYNEKGAYRGKMKGKYQTESKKIERNEALIEIYTLYQSKLATSKLYDYTDMIIEVIKRLASNSDLLLQLQEEYQYILADEHQDANSSQNQLLELLANFHDNPNLFIVGDEKQAIYQFQGASSDNFDHFKKLYPKVKVIALVENYRSTQNVLDSAHSLIGKSKNLAEHNLVPLSAGLLKDKVQSIFVRQFTTEELELRFVAEEIKQLLAKGEPADDIAVLYRDNKDVYDLSFHLKLAGVPFKISSSNDVLGDLQLVKFKYLLQVIADISQEEVLAKVLHFDFLQLGNLDVYRLINFSRAEKRSLVELLTDKDQLAEVGLGAEEKFLDFGQKLLAWNTLAFNQSIREVVVTVLNESGLLEYILALPDSIAVIEKVKRLIKEIDKIVASDQEAKLAQLVEYISVLEEHHLALTTEAFVDTPGVSLMTVHKSKGLEFAYVFIIGARDKHFGNKSRPSYFSVPSRGVASHEPLDDERRLFYVALTRGKKQVNISLADTGNEGQKYLPAVFLEEIDHSLMAPVSVVELEKAYLEDKTYGLRLVTQNSANDFLATKSYIAEVFGRQGLSVTALNNFLECPWKYFFRNLVKLPEAQAKSAVYGSCTHSALEQFFNDYKDSGKLPSKEALLKHFNSAIEGFSLKDGESAELLVKGTEALGGYYDTYKSSFSKDILTEYKIIIPDFLPRVKLNGKLDKLELTDGKVNVVDYKTTKPKSRNEIEGLTKNSNGNFKRQLVFYKILLDEHGDDRLRFVSAELDFLEPSERGIYKKEQFEISSREVEELKEVIARVGQEILQADFWHKLCDDKDCEYCKLRQMME